MATSVGNGPQQGIPPTTQVFQTSSSQESIQDLFSPPQVQPTSSQHDLTGRITPIDETIQKLTERVSNLETVVSELRQIVVELRSQLQAQQKRAL